MWWTLLKLLLGLSVYSTAAEPRFVVRNDERAVIPNLPPAWEGKQVAVFADLQVGMWWSNRDAIRRTVRRVVKLRPALVLIAGDFVYNADSSVDSQMREVIDLLQPLLTDCIPVYAVLGNHDYSLMNEHSDQENHVAHRVALALSRAGIHMMDNSSQPLVAAGGDTLFLVGIGEKWAKNDRVDVALASVPSNAPRIVFMHNPDSFAKIPAGEAPFAVAAHTHGMQIGIPYLSDYLWRHFFSDEGMGVEGWQRRPAYPGGGQVAGDGDGEAQTNNLYITRGIGFSILPARLHAFPELTVFTLGRR
jgi:predicted MPP superfamily phosphohydrolase